MFRRLQPHAGARLFGLPLLLGLVVAGRGEIAGGQTNIPQWSPHRPAPPPLEHPAARAPLSWHPSSTGSQWVLVRNRETAGGLPPYALADAQGKLVRYVEPSPGIPLESYLGQTVEVRHDTGKTVLSSQLVLAGSSLAGPASDRLADQRLASHPGAGSPEGPPRPLGRAGHMAQQLVGEHEAVHDRGPMQSLFEWAGGKRLGRFISVGEPRNEADYAQPSHDVASARAVRHTTASPQWIPPQRW
jgi:hypothetical protein